MTTYNLLQNYWWLIMSVLGALLVFLLMVQGGQSMLIHYGKPDKRALLIADIGIICKQISKKSLTNLDTVND